MDKLIANASVGLARASMNRRGFLGRLARATGGAAVLTGLAAVTVSASSHCWGPYFCETHSDNYCGACGENCSPSSRPYVRRHHGVHCLSGERCPSWTSYEGCGCTIPQPSLPW